MLIRGVPISRVEDYARMFLRDEIISIEKTLATYDEENNIKKLLIQRKRELEEDYEKLEEGR